MHVTWYAVEIETESVTALELC